MAVKHTVKPYIGIFHMEHCECPVCGRIRPKVSFVSGRAWCQVCDADVERTKSGPSDIGRARRINLRGRAKFMLSQARLRAERAGLACTLTLDWVHQRLAAGACEVTGLPFVLDWTGRSSRNPWCPTIDRTINAVGYTTENCRMVCWAYNNAKGDGYHEDVLILARGLLGQSTEVDLLHIVNLAPIDDVPPSNTSQRRCRPCGKLHRRHSPFCSITCQVVAHCSGANDADACWLWTGSVKANGYGVVHVSFAGKRTSMTPARAVYLDRFGDLSSRVPVLNTCGTKNCCNPKHLTIGVETLEEAL